MLLKIFCNRVSPGEMPEILSKGILDWDANFYKNAWNSYYKRGKSFSYLNMKRSLGDFKGFIGSIRSKSSKGWKYFPFEL
jgi:hypothetical protein